MINLSTGPVELKEEVSKALFSRPISHRSPEFQNLYQEFVHYMCGKLNVKQIAVLQGSGTLANEAMIWQIKLLGGKGIVLSNGEFGDRLIDQSQRAQLNFIEYKVSWGNEFDLQEFENLIDTNNTAWILFSHCETSTGVINQLETCTDIAYKKNMRCFVDCMSSIGTQSIDLSNVTMATCSSGKGLSSIPGIALVLSNIQFCKGPNIPKYFDLFMYSVKKIPFTLSSNQLEALFTAAKQIMNVAFWNYSNELSLKVYKAFNSFGIIPFSTNTTRVFTFVQDQINSEEICKELNKIGLVLSYQSDYLLDRNWFQLALFGNHTEEQIELAIKFITKKLCLTSHMKNSRISRELSI